MVFGMERMDSVRIIAVGDNVVDKYLFRGVMYPGGQCVNTCVYAAMNGAEAAYMGIYGKDDAAAHIRHVLRERGIDDSRSRQVEGENGYACVALENNDRIFVGSNGGGVAADCPFHFTPEDIAYIKGFDLLYMNSNSFIERELSELVGTGVPIVFDFSSSWDDGYLAQICPHIEMATLSCAHLSDKDRETEMQKAAALGVKIVLGTVGERGSYLLYQGEFFAQPAIAPERISDTMGAGDSYFAAFLVSLLRQRTDGGLYGGDIRQKLQTAMRAGAEFAAKICEMEGAFGCGIPLTGGVVDRRAAST